MYEVDSDIIVDRQVEQRINVQVCIHFESCASEVMNTFRKAHGNVAVARTQYFE